MAEKRKVNMPEIEAHFSEDSDGEVRLSPKKKLSIQPNVMLDDERMESRFEPSNARSVRLTRRALKSLGSLPSSSGATVKTESEQMDTTDSETDSKGKSIRKSTSEETSLSASTSDSHASGELMASSQIQMETSESSGSQKILHSYMPLSGTGSSEQSVSDQSGNNLSSRSSGTQPTRSSGISSDSSLLSLSNTPSAAVSSTDVRLENISSGLSSGSMSTNICSTTSSNYEAGGLSTTELQSMQPIVCSRSAPAIATEHTIRKSEKASSLEGVPAVASTSEAQEVNVAGFEEGVVEDISTSTQREMENLAITTEDEHSSQEAHQVKDVYEDAESQSSVSSQSLPFSPSSGSLHGNPPSSVESSFSQTQEQVSTTSANHTETSSSPASTLANINPSGSAVYVPEMQILRRLLSNPPIMNQEQCDDIYRKLIQAFPNESLPKWVDQQPMFTGPQVFAVVNTILSGNQANLTEPSSSQAHQVPQAYQDLPGPQAPQAHRVHQTPQTSLDSQTHHTSLDQTPKTSQETLTSQETQTSNAPQIPQSSQPPQANQVPQTLQASQEAQTSQKTQTSNAKQIPQVSQVPQVSQAVSKRDEILKPSKSVQEDTEGVPIPSTSSTTYGTCGGSSTADLA